MTARDFPPVSSQANDTNAATDTGGDCELNRKRSLFLDFCQDWLLGPSSQHGANTADEDQLLAELFKGSQGPPQGIINDLPGVLSVRSPAEAAADASKLDQTSAPVSADQAPAAVAGKPLYHRAVVTSMPMPATTRAAAAGDVQDDDTSSQATMPMPARKRGRSDEDDEACSSPNDLVEVPAAQTAAARKRQHTAAGPSSQHDASSSRRDQSGTTSSAVNGNAAAAASPDVHKGILVAKVLTKSDANSKRVILPRIAVETNLPQLNSAPHFHFTATDPKGAAWPLVIKAWANGSNPKPVYVMEMIGDVLKQYKLTIGDAVALLADEDGRFYLEWNTEGARAASARPTYSGIVFKSSGSSSSAEAPAEAEPKPETPTAAAAASAGVPVKQEPQQLQHQQPAAVPVRSPFATAEEFAAAQAAAAAAAATSAPPFPIKQEQQQQQQQQVVPAAVPASSAAVAAAVPGPVTASQQQQLFQQLPASANMPLMTAIPVTSPQVPGTFIPTSPCQLLVVGHLPMPDLDLDLEGLQPSLPSSMLGQLNANGDVVMPPASAPYGCSLETAQSTGDEALLVPTGAMPQLSHAGGVLLCPRTPGCTRPAGHQGWCLGHKGYKKRRA